MSNLDEYLAKRGVTPAQMEQAERETQTSHMTQVQVAKAIGVSQNRVSRIENGDLGAMSVDSLRRYVAALGGSLTLVATLPGGRFEIV